jgi:hypothetical protein
VKLIFDRYGLLFAIDGHIEPVELKPALAARSARATLGNMSQQELPNVVVQLSLKKTLQQFVVCLTLPPAATL